MSIFAKDPKEKHSKKMVLNLKKEENL